MKFVVSSGPFVKDTDDTKKIELKFLIALIPIICFGIFKSVMIYFFGGEFNILEILNPLFMILVGMLTSYVSEYLYNIIFNKLSFKKSFYKTNKSYAIFPGMILALLLPPNLPLLLVVLGAFISTILGKMIFGGFGKNLFNPSIVGYLFLCIIFLEYIFSFSNSFELSTVGALTPLENFSNLGFVSSYESVVGPYGSILNFLIGSIPGSIGEISKILIFISFLYLALTKTIKWKISILYILTIFIMTMLIGLMNGIGIWYPIIHILCGNILFVSVFVITDPVTSPKTSLGQILYAVLLGVITVVLRFSGFYYAEVIVSILLLNLIVPLLDNIALKIYSNEKFILIPFVILVLIVSFATYNISNYINENHNNITYVKS